MAPGAKRKRPDNRYDQNDSPNRPSPHRPHTLGLSQQQGNRRGSRSGPRGGSSAPQSPSVAHPSPSAMAPPASVTQSNKPQPAPSSTTPAQNNAADEKPASPTVPASNQYLTQAVISSWSQARRAAVVDAARAAQADDDMLTLSLVLEEIIQACLNETLSPDVVASMVQEIVTAAAPDTLDPVSCFLDTVSTLMETETVNAPLEQMLVATGIDIARMRAEFEISLLTSLDLVRNTFSRVAIRKATHALYRQSNYNLLREETEGYAKLMTEYFTTVHSKPPTQDVVNETLQRMNALIGAFDLDVGRVLDVTLDVFANLLVKHGRFFVKFLRTSPWWPKLSIKDGIEWTEPVVSTLPGWASPESDLWYYTDEQKNEQLQLREQRDKQFWKSMEPGDDAIKAFFELGARRITNSGSLPPPAKLSDSADTTKLSEKEKMQKWSEEFMAQTQTLPPLGNPDAAQLLGFKLRFYASDARDAHDTLPDNLISLAALLIKIGFISLVDLYPHLYPEYTPEQKQKLKDAKKEKESKLRGKVANALTMAAALPDEGQPHNASVSRLRESESKPSSKAESERSTPMRTEEVKEKLPEPVDQKVALLRSLLCIGAIPEAMFILGRDPWLLDIYDDLRTYLSRLAHHALSKVYVWAKPYTQQPLVPKQGPPNTQTPRATDYPPRRSLRWTKLEEKDAGDGIDYRFYWDDWADNVPVCQDVDDVFKLGDSLLAFIGVECGKDAVLLAKLARIGRKSLAEDSSPSNRQRWIDFSSLFLSPALTFSGQNPGVVNEVWDLLREFDTSTRYAIYATWFHSSKAALRSPFNDVTVRTKDILKRISSENTKEMGRQLAKLAYACPGIVFELALKQAQGYGNMVNALVESCRYLTDLGYDCLTWTMLKTFNSGRGSLQADGMLTAPWLKNTADFVGKAYKRYNLMDPTPVLKCVAHQLVDGKGNLSMLPILTNIITSMAGFKLNESIPKDFVVLGLSAGPHLRRHTQEHWLQDTRHAHKTSARRLLRFLMDSGESQLASVILVALALETERYVYRPETEDLPTKVLTTNLDNLRAHFAQYLDFLRSNLSIQEFDATVPGFMELMSDYGVDLSLAFTISRPSLSAKARAARMERRKSVAKVLTEQDASLSTQRVEADGDIVMESSDTTSPPAINGTVGAPRDSAKQSGTPPGDVEMKGVAVDVDVTTKDTSNTVTEASATPSAGSNPVIEALAMQMRTAFPDLYSKHPCLTFLVTFWELSLPDMFSIKAMEEYSKASSHYIDQSRKLGHTRNRDVTEKRAALDVKIKGLKSEADEMSATAGQTRTHLREEMKQWFDGIPMVDRRSEFLHETLLEECFLPRARLSPEDAQFCSAMLIFMHKAGVPGFRTMKLLDQLFRMKSMGDCIAMCTPREASNLGRFLNEVLKELSVWHISEAKFTSVAQGQEERLPGFGRTFNPDRTPSSFISYEEYRHVLHKWHSQLLKAIEECLLSKDFAKMRNVVLLVKEVADVFPRVDSMAKSLIQVVENLNKTDSREDVRTVAGALLGTLKGKEKSWVSEQAFHAVRHPVSQNSPLSKVELQKKPIASNSAGSEKPKPASPQEAGAPKLNAAANSFNPRNGNTNGITRAPSRGSNEHDDSKRQPTQSQSESRSTTQSQNRNPDPKDRGLEELKPTTGPIMHSSNTASVSGRPDSRGSSINPTPSNRVPHALPSKPDTQPLRPRPSDRGTERPGDRPVERLGDRPVDRPVDYHHRGRNEPRGNPSIEYGRLDRDPVRDPFPGRREASPLRRDRTRSPDRRDYPGRDYNDRSMPPPRDGPRAAGRGAGWGDQPRDPRDMRDMRDPRDHRDSRDSRDMRDRMDPRGPAPPPAVDSRSRMHAGPTVVPEDTSSYRREYPPKPHQGGDRGNNTPTRPSNDRIPNGAPPAMDRAAPASDRSMINPERAFLINNEERGRNENFRPDRDARRDRVSSPRRGDERAPIPFNSRGDASRDPRDDRTPPQPFPANRERRDAPIGGAPTGPRGGRPDISTTGRLSREMFEPSQPSRPAAHQAQDPNYGRLNPPPETPHSAPPSGPRSLTTDRRSSQANPPAPPPPPHPAPSATPTQPSGVHPSRLGNIGGALPLQTDIPGPPSGPRNMARTPQSTAASPLSRNFPTGPAANERNSRGQDRNPLRAINNVLTQNAPNDPDRPGDRNPPSQSPQIRGRGANRASGVLDDPSISNTIGSQSHPGTPNAFRPDAQHARTDKVEPSSGRLDAHSQDEGRLNSRGHSRRSERSGRNRSRSPDRSDRRPDERSSRVALEERGGRPDEQERASDRERGSGREKSRSDRDSSRRDREREGDRTRDGRDRRDRTSGRGEEAGSRRGAPPTGDHRSGETRGRGNDRKDDRDRRSGRDEGRDRKRGRGLDDPHGDNKRSRPST